MVKVGGGGGGRGRLAVMAAVCALAVAAAPGAGAVPQKAGEASERGAFLPHRPADEAANAESYEPQGERIRGASRAGKGPSMTVRRGYRDDIGPGETRHYTVRLDAESTAHVSAVAVPAPGSTVTADVDGIRISLRSGSGALCGQARPTIVMRGTAQPLADSASRQPGPGTPPECQRAGAYDVAVERVGGEGAGPDRWPMELRFTLERPVAADDGREARPPRDGWSTEPPTVPDQPARARKGGSAFRDAEFLSTGVWEGEIKPGETRFYRVPLLWGQRLYAVVGPPTDADRKGPGALGDAVGLTVYNPERGLVGHGRAVEAAGRPTEDAVGPTAPVAYANRYDRTRGEVRAMSLAGSYYLAVTLDPKAKTLAGGAVPVTLRVVVTGRAQVGPRYAPAATGGPEGPDRADGAAADTDDDGLRAVAYAGFGTGTALLLGLGLWTLVARRRTGAGHRPTTG
ncbi:hypothetical protein LRS74_16550 [Streptomyces sp. LX-29]|uniref:hypothetical protein n=1 Tax=Streptomyces sp. LX-29 TaxID=2900152 RepID=UPI00240E2A5B|nr:hypothetical protein [Streptomyces sp. LX-29]WFB08477.1 hypothetical protein LRS74_16550 [Streptomyces sp. LX-29]